MNRTLILVLLFLVLGGSAWYLISNKKKQAGSSVSWDMDFAVKNTDEVGKIFIAFTVEIDGTLADIRSLKDPGFGTGAEAVKVLQKSPNWIPGRKDGKKVRVNHIVPIGIHTE